MNKLITLFVLLLILSLPVSLAYSLTYDANGNLVTGDGYFRVYDASNHLRNVYSGSSLVNNNLLENYTWALDDTRIFIKYVYNNGSLNETVFYPREDWVRVKNSSGTFDFFYAIQNGEIVSVLDSNNKKFFFHNDADGSPRLVTDQNGNVSEQTFYDPYGGIISGGVYTRFDYEGEEQDSATSTIDFDARMYNPKDPMFTQPDTIIQNVYDPQSLNHYVFERDNPYKYKDETGHWQELAIAGAFVVGFTYGEIKYQVTTPGYTSSSENLIAAQNAGISTGLKAAASVTQSLAIEAVLAYTGIEGGTLFVTGLVLDTLGDSQPVGDPKSDNSNAKSDSGSQQAGSNSQTTATTSEQTNTNSQTTNSQSQQSSSSSAQNSNQNTQTQQNSGWKGYLNKALNFVTGGHKNAKTK